MLNGVILSAIGGAIGGGLGGGIGWLYDRATKKPSGKTSRLAGGLAIVFALVGARAANYVARPSVDDQLAAASPVFPILKQYYPTEYSSMVARLQQGGSTLEMQNAIRPTLGKIITDHRKEIDDDNAVQLMRLTLDESRELAKVDAKACVSMLMTGTSGIDLGTSMPAALIKRDQSTTSAILEQIATQPAPAASPPPESVMTEVAKAAASRLSANDQKLAVPLVAASKPPTTPEEAHASCSFYENLAEEILRQPPSIVRGVMATT